MRIILIFCIALLGMACTERITFETQIEEDLIVVDGFITDAPGPHHIKIAKAIKFTNEINEGQEPPVQNALVMVEDDFGNVTTLREFEPGNYITASTFSGIAGRTYTLHIVLEDGREIISTPQFLASSGEELSVSYRLVRNTTNPLIFFDIKYYIDFDFSQEDQYYKWDWEETYMFPTLCLVTDIVCRDTPMYRVDDNVPEWCYVKDSLPENYIKLAAASDYNTNEVTNYELDQYPFTFKYFEKNSINVRQYSIGKEAHDYWSLVEVQVKGTGTIFDAAPAPLLGNLSMPDNRPVPVLGFFGAYGTTSTRIFIDIGGIPPVCIRRTGVPNYCDDCRWWGNGVAEKPEYWDD